MQEYSDEMKIDLNCDLGETDIPGEGNDERLMPYLSSANIACGGHAGSVESMRYTITLALRFGVGVGAHPGYPDREGFGRRKMKIAGCDLRESLATQIETLRQIAAEEGVRLRHVKPHGALYNEAARDAGLALLIAGVVKEIDRQLILVGLSGSEIMKAAEKEGLGFRSEVFADRAYNDDGTLVPRETPGALLHDTDVMIGRVIRMAEKGEVITISGMAIPIKADTVCIHGDNKTAPMFVKELADELKSRKIEIRMF